MNKVNITLEDLKNLLVTSVRSNTLPAWCEVALEWAQQANDEIIRLQKELSQAQDKASRLQFPDTTGG
jgi:hypothetical protein